MVQMSFNQKLIKISFFNYAGHKLKYCDHLSLSQKSKLQAKLTPFRYFISKCFDFF
jgi:hypothetical protein